LQEHGYFCTLKDQSENLTWDETKIKNWNEESKENFGL